MKKKIAAMTLGSFSMLSADPYYQQYQQQSNPQTYYRTNPSYQSSQGDYYQDPNQGYYQQIPGNAQYPSNQYYYTNQPYQTNPAPQYYQPNQNDQRQSLAPRDFSENPSESSSSTKDAGPSDQQLSKNIHEVIYGWFSSGNQSVSFEIDGGDVTLTGSVNSEEEKRKIEEAVKKIPGVKKINNQLAITPSKKLTYYQPQKVTNTVLTDKKVGKDYAVLESDKKINAQIRDKLDQRSFERIAIITANGVVTLGGSVDNPDEFELVVSEIAKMDGVKKVNNRVNIKSNSR